MRQPNPTAAAGAEKEILFGQMPVHVVEPAYAPGCMLRRNRAMLQAADWLISVYDGSGGGTGAAVAYANRLGLPVEAIWL